MEVYILKESGRNIQEELAVFDNWDAAHEAAEELYKNACNVYANAEYTKRNGLNQAYMHEHMYAFADIIGKDFWYDVRIIPKEVKYVKY